MPDGTIMKNKDMPKSKKYRKKPRGYRRKLANAPNFYNRHEPPQIGYAYNQTNPNDPFINSFHQGNRRYQDREKLESLKRVKNRQGIQTGLMAENFKKIESAYYSSTATADRITAGLQGIHDEVTKLNQRSPRPEHSVVAGEGVVRASPPPIPSSVESNRASRLKDLLKGAHTEPFLDNPIKGLHGLTPPIGNFSVTTTPGARDARAAYEAAFDAAGVAGNERLAETHTPSPGATNFLARLSTENDTFTPIENTTSPGFTLNTDTVPPKELNTPTDAPSSPYNRQAAREYGQKNQERRNTLVGGSSKKQLRLEPNFF
jgi:hypothetical protein